MNAVAVTLARALDALIEATAKTELRHSEAMSAALRAMNTYHTVEEAEQAYVASTIVGICPLCGTNVYANDLDGPVWTCPRDLDPNNRYWEPSDVTTEQQDRDEVWSFCYEDHGGYCDDHMPMHSKCYDGLFTTKGE